MTEADLKRRQKEEGRGQKVTCSDGDLYPNRTIQPLEDGELNPQGVKYEGNKSPSASCGVPSALRAKPVKHLIQQQLPELISQDPQIRDFILRTVSNYYAPKQETESRFDQILRELREDRERQDRKWEEQNRKWDEATKRFDKMQEQIDRHSQQIDQSLAEIQKLYKQYDSAIGHLLLLFFA